MSPQILVIGACGQLGVELVTALRNKYGTAAVMAADIKEQASREGEGEYVYLNVFDKESLSTIVTRKKITEIYLLAAMLSATGEKHPLMGWNLNMQGLLNVLEVAREQKLAKIFWPSSIAVFGNTAPKINCPQDALLEPATVYGISKKAGEDWCRYYHDRYGLDIRSLRYPGLVSWKSAPGGGTTDYAVDIFHKAVTRQRYTCFLSDDTRLPMLYMEDAVRATLELMEAPSENITIRGSYNLAGISFSPAELSHAIRKHNKSFEIEYRPDFRQQIAGSWPYSIDDSAARMDWNWQPQFDLARMTRYMYSYVTGICASEAEPA